MAFVYVFPIVVNDAVVGLGLRFCCDFGGWGLRLWMVVAVAVVVEVMAVVGYAVIGAMGCVGGGGHWLCGSVVACVVRIKNDK